MGSFQMGPGEKNEGGQETCPVCNSKASLRCAGCKDQFYCSTIHQREDWSRHKSACRAWSLDTNKELGRFLVANKNLKEGDLIISEVPIVWGPARHSDARICVGCGDSKVAVRCPGCSWFACKLSCDGLVDVNRHAAECKLLAKARIIPRCDILLILRIMILKKRSFKKWETLSSLQSHESLRGEGTEAFEEDKMVFQYLATIMEHLSIDKETLTKICGLIDVNALETNPPEGSLGIYPTACFLEHRCLANTRHTFDLDAKGRPKITITAVRDIDKGEHLSLTYTHVLWATRARREHLLSTKFFVCNCERCEDPSELASHLGTLRCPCGPGFILPKNPLDEDTEWSCNLCPGILSSADVIELIDRLDQEVENAMESATEENLSSLLSRLEVLLHPNHQYCIAAGHTLIQLLSKSNPKKKEICKRIINTTSILDPYGARLSVYTAVTLRELAFCPGENSKELLERGIELLRYEPPKSPGYELKRVMEAELSKIS